MVVVRSSSSFERRKQVWSNGEAVLRELRNEYAIDGLWIETCLNVGNENGRNDVR